MKTVLKGGSASSKAHARHNPTANAFLISELSASVVGFRLVKASVKTVFTWDRLYIAGGSSSAFPPVEVTNVLSDTNGPGVGIRLVRRGA